MSTFHKSVYISRFIKLLKAQEMSGELELVEKDANDVYQDCVNHLLQNLASLEHDSLLHLLTALSQQ